MVLLNNRLNAGFFSNFNAAIDWAWYSKVANDPTYIHWNGFESQDGNMFEKLFRQKYVNDKCQNVYNGYYRWSPYRSSEVDNLRRITIPDLYDAFDGWFFCDEEVYRHPQFNTLRHVLHTAYTEQFSFNENLQFPLADFSLKTLGVQYRFIVHYRNKTTEVPISSIMTLDEYNELYIKQIEDTFEKGNFEQIYLGCDQENFLQLCHKKFGDKIICTEHIRSVGINDWTSKIIQTNNSLLDEWVYVLTDAINLSKCDYFLGSPSNVTFGVLTLNPNLNFEMFKHLKHMLTL